VDGDVAAAQVRRADVRDERLVRGPVEALTAAEDPAATANATNAAVASSQAPVASTSSQATAHSRGISASARMRRRPSIQRESGSCTMTIVAVLTAKTRPISRSLT